MALNFKTLGTRALTALVFVALLLGCLLWNYYSFAIFFFVVAMMGLNEFYDLSDKLGAKPYKITGFILAALIYCSFAAFPGIFSDLYKLRPALLVAGPFIILTAALFSKRERPIQNTVFTIAGLIYAVLPFCLMHRFVSYDAEYFPNLLLGIILLIWSNDTFAYLGGSVFGKHKMIERISPGKTWEGTSIGVLVTIGSGYIIGSFILQQSVGLWMILGFIVPVLATIGDLVESMLKRQAGVKDSGNLMPGHGGILDRFDSLIFVTPFVYAFIELVVL